MNNGYTRESKHRIAVLEEEDVETFVAFCEYAYTGDYNVPQLPAHREEERIRVAIAETATSPAKSWRGLHRSDSMSSGVPPPAPSPPPESVASVSQTVKPQNEPEPVIEEEPTADATAVKEEETVSQEKEETQVEHESQNTPEEPVASLQTEIELEDAAQEPGMNAGPVNEADELEDQSPAEKKKTKKLSKKKKKHASKPSTEEAVVNLTPPSTPPPEAPMEVNEAPGEASTPEQAFEEPVGSGEASWWEEPTAAEPETTETHEPYEAEAQTETGPEPAPDSEQVRKAEISVEEWTEPAEDQPAEDTLQQDQWHESNGETETEKEPKQAPPTPFIDMSFAKQSQSDSSPRTPGLSLWDEFAGLQYEDEKQDSNQNTPSSSTSDLPYLTFHAKVYVFATRYLIPALAQLCLRKLHRDLLSLALEDADTMNSMMDSQVFDNMTALQIPMVLDLLRYAYTKTTRLEPISPTSATQLRENELRRLIAHYAACKVKELARYHLPGDSGAATPAVRPTAAKGHRIEATPPKSLRSLLDMTPELASDLVYRMM
ncbi:hypothetical protein N7478_000345 [Penicillium angulare]|uniref:uncharacterized protein n=1 Tax=Penicillium angulare TaxID=116970 RepID=UPI002540BEF1|nr:uncharacterized protein N7478_000345 [Penicillium angulare]KAJ5291094.1 hypothetical protein N7478_000345 [Penicillium angulare]